MTLPAEQIQTARSKNCILEVEVLAWSSNEKRI